MGSGGENFPQYNPSFLTDGRLVIKGKFPTQSLDCLLCSYQILDQIVRNRWKKNI